MLYLLHKIIGHADKKYVTVKFGHCQVTLLISSGREIGVASTIVIV